MSLYRLPSESRDEFKTILENLESNFDHLAKKPYMMVFNGDFNAKSNSLYANHNTNIERSKIEILTSSFGFNQVINEPTHF